MDSAPQHRLRPLVLTGFIVGIMACRFIPYALASSNPLQDWLWGFTPLWAAMLFGVAHFRPLWLGWAVLVGSTFLINHFELFGLSQVFTRLFGKQSSEPEFRMPLLYRYVRHPIYLGVMLAIWSTPVMTVGHLLFSAAITAYTLIAIQLEEHDLIDQFGDQYRRYRQQAAMLVPIPGRKSSHPKEGNV